MLRKNRILFLVFLLSFVIGLGWIIISAASFRTVIASDFINYLTGANIIKGRDGRHLYDIETNYYYQQKIVKPYVETDSLLPFRSLPVAALPFLPFTYFSLLTGYRIFAFAMIFLMLVVTYNLPKFFTSLRKYHSLQLIPFVFFPNIVAIFLGQHVFLYTLIFLLIYKFLKKGKYLLTGIFAGLLFLRLHYIVFLPFLFLMAKNKKMMVYGLALTTSIIFLVSFVLTGVGGMIHYPGYLYVTENELFGSRPWHMFSLYSALAHIYPGEKLASATAHLINLFIYIYVLYLFYMNLHSTSKDLLFAAAIILTTLLSVHTLVHDLSILMLPILILIENYRKVVYKKYKRFFLLVIIYLFLLPLVRLSGSVSFIFAFITLAFSILLINTSRSGFRNLVPV